MGGHMPLAHRLAYLYFIGEIPADLEMDHLCRNRACVNPTHVEPVTHAENVNRGALKALITDDIREKFARTKRGKHRPWTPEWVTKFRAGHRQFFQAQTHCLRGHLFTDANIEWSKDGRRSCKTCRREAKRRRYWQKKAVVA